MLCSLCKGEEFIEVDVEDAEGNSISKYTLCPRCHGEGEQ
jgi:DnaJ-class molecular chaperone